MVLLTIANRLFMTRKEIYEGVTFDIEIMKILLVLAMTVYNLNVYFAANSQYIR